MENLSATKAYEIAMEISSPKYKLELDNVLLLIKLEVEKGNFSLLITIMSEYVKIKLNELGYTVSNVIDTSSYTNPYRSTLTNNKSVLFKIEWNNKKINF